MNETLKNEKNAREYLLGRVSDETRLAEFEELLFLDEDFCSLAEIVEDELINDFVFGRLNETDSADFAKTLENNAERRGKIALTNAIKEKAAAQNVAEKETKPSFFESIKAFFQKPVYIGAFAVLLIGIFALLWFVLSRQNTNELAKLKSIYNKERPLESRISEFDYAPLAVTRGAAEEREKNKLRIIENNLLTAVEKNPNAQNHHALGVFYLTQRKFGEAIAELEKAVKLDEKDAKARNDLGSVYFEKAKTEPNEKKLETLAKSFENFSKAFESDPHLLAALFNKSLCLQELRLYNQAKESWNLYLEKDANSGWANEARKNLERLEQLKLTSKTKEQVLEDFLAAYRNRDEETAWKINSQTREMISGVWLADQLSRRFLEAKIRGDDALGAESIEALKFIGDLEKTRNADFFVAELAEFYAKTSEFQNLLDAKNLLFAGFTQLITKEIGKSKTSFEESKKAFENAGNLGESRIADLWIAHSLSDLSQINKSNEILARLTSECDRKNYRWLNLAVADWVSNNFILQNEFTKSIEIAKNNLKSAEELADTAVQSKMLNVLAAYFNDIGELDKALFYLGKAANLANFYNRSEIRNWQTDYYSASVFNKLKMFEIAGNFGREALFIVQNSPYNKSQAVGDTFQLLLKISKDKKDFPQALRFAEASLRFAESTEDERFKAKMVQYATLEVADLKREMGNFEEALREYENVIEILKKSPEIKVDNYSAQKGKLLCLLALGGNSEITEELNKTLELSEKYRSEILDEEARNAFFANEELVYDIAVENALRVANPQKAFEFAETSKARTLLDFVQGETSVLEIEKKFPAVAKPLSFKEIQAKLPPDVQIVEYFLLNDKLVIWQFTNDKFETVEKPISAEIVGQKTADFLSLIVKDKENSVEIRNKADELLELLLAPILPNLDKQKQVVFIPDKSLYKLPFAALFSKKTNRFLIEDFTVSYSPSANVFVKTSETARQRESIKNESLLSVGNPQFDYEENPNLADLPAAEIEARKIAEFYPKNKLLIGANATKETVLSEIAENSIFHFAGHYVTNEASSPNSKILLARQSGNGDLRVSEIAEKRLAKSKFVVLSACETNGEKVFQGEGATGIARTFLAIGAPIVLASNWKVDSEASKDLMISFHRNRTEKGLKIAEALRQAQIEMLKNADANFQSPYFWSAFSAVGGYTNY